MALENKIRLYYTRRGGGRNRSAIDEAIRQCWLGALNEKKRSAIVRLHHKSDQDNSLLGLRLLKKAAEESGISGFSLTDIVYPESGKPYWSTARGCMDFNITHSADLVMVALGLQTRLGLDAEKIRPLKSLAFKSVMQPEELARIARQPEIFFRLWSIKEAIVKAADCTGLSRMREVDIAVDGNTAVLNSQRWYLNTIALDPVFCITLASSAVPAELEIKQFYLNELV